VREGSSDCVDEIRAGEGGRGQVVDGEEIREEERKDDEDDEAAEAGEEEEEEAQG
jgi:hypothetical protein